MVLVQRIVEVVNREFRRPEQSALEATAAERGGLAVQQQPTWRGRREPPQRALGRGDLADVTSKIAGTRATVTEVVRNRVIGGRPVDPFMHPDPGAAAH